MKRYRFVLFIIIFLSGCQGGMFRNIKYVDMSSLDPLTVKNNFSQSFAGAFEVVNSLVFEYKLRSITGIGYTSVDILNRNFDVACFNPLGVKLFEVSGKNDNLESKFAIPELARRANFAKFIGQDIQRIYFNLVPEEDAKIYRTKKAIIYRDLKNKDIIEYVFAGKDAGLVQKSFYQNNKIIWRVNYCGYLQKGGKIYPELILFRNFRYGYKLTLRLKQIK